jgi:cell division inhibitor SulA
MSKLEEVIETIKDKASACGTTQSGRARKGAYVDCIMMLKDLTSSHREEIEAAYNAGQNDTVAWRKFKDASDYYEKTFGK